MSAAPRISAALADKSVTREGSGAMQMRLREGDSVWQPDGSWARVVGVDGHGAWLEGGLVTAHVTDAAIVRLGGTRSGRARECPQRHARGRSAQTGREPEE